MTTNYMLNIAIDSLCDKVMLFLESEQKLAVKLIRQTTNKKDIESVILDQIQLIESISLPNEFLSNEKVTRLEQKKSEFIGELISSL